MRLCLMTGAAPRHAAAVRALRDAGHDVAVVVDRAATPCHSTELPPSLRRYFEKVRAAEQMLYGARRDDGHGEPEICADLTAIDRPCAAGRVDTEADTVWRMLEQAEGIVLYGCSYLSGALLNRLSGRHTISVHMGIAPFYRGAAANFWAAYDGHPWLIGATAHFLTAARDAGPVLFHARPPLTDPARFEYFSHAMASTGVAFNDLGQLLAAVAPAKITPQETAAWPILRTTTAAAFTDGVAQRFLSRPTPLIRAEFKNIRLPVANEHRSHVRAAP